jgi:hypothetical protein
VEETDSSSRDSDDEDDAGEKQGNSGRTFNQTENNLTSYVLATVIKRGILSVDEMKAVIRRACTFFKFPARPEYSTGEGIQAIVRQINRDVRKLNLVVKSVFCEITGNKFYTVRVDRHSAITKFQTEFKKAEIAIINECVQAMFRSRTLSLSLRDCLNVGRKHSKMQYVDGKKFFRKLMRMAYFVINVDEEHEEDDDFYSLTLGCRALEEFLGLLQENYPGLLKNCKICAQPMLHGYDCPQCEVSVHRHCCEGYVRNAQVCPGDNCNAKWSCVSALSKRTFQLDVNRNENESQSSQPSGGDGTNTATTTEEEV